ncbi:putative melanin biosynthetic process [Trypoxylus dichotomus]
MPLKLPIVISYLILTYLSKASAITYRSTEIPDRGYKAFAREFSINPTMVNEADSVMSGNDPCASIIVFNLFSELIVYFFCITTQILCQVWNVCGTANFKARSANNSKFRTVFQWKLLDFDYENEADKQKDIREEVFIPGNAAPIDTDVYYGRKNKYIFITIPRFQPGIPATLGTVTVSKTTGDPVIRPYPSWKWHRYPKKCRQDRIVSTYRVKVDTCGRLWVLDTGRLSEDQVCPMQILAFDLESNKLVHRGIIPQSLLKPTSILVTPIVEILNGNCQDTFVYIADTVAFTLIIHDVKNGAFWKASDKTMYPYPNYSSFGILGDTFDLVDGILGMDIGPIISREQRKLFFHALSSVTENWVLTSSLRNRSLFGEYPWVHPNIFHVYNGTRRSQSAAQAIEKDGVSFFGDLTELTINCWNTATDFGPENIDVVEYNPETLQFPSGIKVINNPIDGSQELWILTSKLQKVIAGTLKSPETNFRIMTIKVDDALSDTKCKKRSSKSNLGYTASFYRG